jgi:hypothetical protein
LGLNRQSFVLKDEGVTLKVQCGIKNFVGRKVLTVFSATISQLLLVVYRKLMSGHHAVWLKVGHQV